MSSGGAHPEALEADDGGVDALGIALVGCLIECVHLGAVLDPLAAPLQPLQASRDEQM